MFSSRSPSYPKLRTNLKLSINRLKLLEKKKTELALKARKEIADYIGLGKEERARIRVEHIIREDFMVEAMEIIEMFCDLLLARFGMLEKMKELDPGLEECIATLLWAAPRLQSDVQEMKEIAHQLTLKYGKEYADMCRSNGFENVHEKVLIKMGTQAPPKILIENYMIEIARAFGVPFEPDPSVMNGDDTLPIVDNLIDVGFDSIDPNKGGSPHGGGGTSNGGGGGTGGGASNDWLPPKPGLIPPDAIPPYRTPENDPAPPYSPPQYGFHDSPSPVPSHPAQYAPPPMAGYAPHSQPTAGSIPVLPSPPGMDSSVGHSSSPIPPYQQQQQQHPSPPHGGGGVKTQPPPLPHHPPNAGSSTGIPNIVPPAEYLPTPAQQGPSAPSNELPELPSLPDIPGLPSVPQDSVQSGRGTDDIDFDDLTKRFEDLKRRK